MFSMVPSFALGATADLASASLNKTTWLEGFAPGISFASSMMLFTFSPF